MLAADRRHLVVRARPDPRLPSPLPDPLLRQPRHAHRQALARLEDRHRRQPRVRRRHRRPPRRDAGERTGWRPSSATRPASPSPTRAAGSAASTASSSPPIPTRRWRCSPSRPRPSGGPVQLRLLQQRDGAAHRRIAAAARGRRPRLLELPARGLHRHGTGGGQVTYHMNRLQALDEPDPVLRHAERSGGGSRPRHELRADGLRAPVYTLDSLAAQRRLPALSGAGRHRLLRRLPRLGLPRGRLRRPACGRALALGCALVTAARSTRAGSMHTRPTGQPRPLPRSATASTCGWSTSTTPPRLPLVAAPAGGGFEAATTSATPTAACTRTWTRSWPRHGVDLDGGRVLHAGQPAGARATCSTRCRCTGATTPPASLRCIVAEVHNTYGERHGYLLGPDERGRAEADKAFYVSPFLTVDGRYRMRFSAPGRAAADHDGAAAGRRDAVHRPRCPRRRPAADERRCWRARAPLPDDVPRGVSALIRWHGVKLWLRRLPVVPRPPRPADPYVTVARRASPSATARAAARRGARGRAAAARAVHARIAERSSGARCPLAGARVCPTARARRRRQGAPVMHWSGRRPSSPGWARREDRLRRGLHDRRLDDGPRHRPRRPAGRRSPAGCPRSCTRCCSGCGTWSSAPSRRTRRTAEEQPDQHLPALRPVQRAVRAVPRRDDDLLVGLVRARRHPAPTPSAARWTAILDLARVRAGMHVLEIGSGWGGLAIRAARERGARVTTLTLSTEQQALARQRAEEAGVGHLVDVRLQDYRDATGQFDAIVSVEMIEAVGEAYWPTYFAALDTLLAPGGRVGLQAITMAHDRLMATRRSYTWIHKYVFPGGIIPSIRSISDNLAAHTGCRSSSAATSARTTRARWRSGGSSSWATGTSCEGSFDDTFRRMWEFYLAYCEAGFRVGYLGVEPARPGPAPVRGPDVELRGRADLGHRRLERHRRGPGPRARRPGRVGGDQRPARRAARARWPGADARRPASTSPTGRRPWRRRRRCASALGGLDVAVLNAGTWSRFDVRAVGQRGVRRPPGDQPDGHRCTARGRRCRRCGRGRGQIVGTAAWPATAASRRGGLRGDQGGAAQPVRVAARSPGAARRRRQTVAPGSCGPPMTDRNTFPMPFMVSPEEAARAHRRRDREGQGRDRLPAADDADDEGRPAGAGPAWTALMSRYATTRQSQ